MDARHHLRLAEALVVDVHNHLIVPPALVPAACRTSISRAYYAAFLVATEFLDFISVVVAASPQAHVTVQHALNNSGDAGLARASSNLRTLFSARLAADYDMGTVTPENPAHASALLALARDLITHLDRLMAGTAAVPFDPVATASAILGWAAVTGKANVKRK